jgi:hypothetical protein
MVYCSGIRPVKQNPQARFLLDLNGRVTYFTSLLRNFFLAMADADWGHSSVLYGKRMFKGQFTGLLQKRMF